jgi:surface antigen
MLTGCSVSFPISPLVAPGSGDDSSEEMARPALASLLETGDWPSAKAALSTALDPQRDGTLAGWANPASGHKGSFVPIGKAYPSDTKICRVFLAKIDREGSVQSAQGTACAERDGEWSIAGAGPWKKV